MKLRIGSVAGLVILALLFCCVPRNQGPVRDATAKKMYDAKIGADAPWEGNVCRKNSDCHSDLECRDGFERKVLDKVVNNCDSQKEASIAKEYDSMGCSNLALCIARDQYKKWKKHYEAQEERDRVKKKKYIAVLFGAKAGPNFFFSINKRKDGEDWVGESPFFTPLSLRVNFKFSEWIGVSTDVGTSLVHIFDVGSGGSNKGWAMEFEIKAALFLSLTDDRFRVSLGYFVKMPYSWIGEQHPYFQFMFKHGVFSQAEYFFYGGPGHKPFSSAVQFKLGSSLHQNNDKFLMNPYLGLSLAIYWSPAHAWR